MTRRAVACAAVAAVMCVAGVPSVSRAAAVCEPADGFVGTVCTPGTPGAHPLVVVLGGSLGGDRLAPLARRFAERGYVGASVAYFAATGLPRTLDEIPVETVGTALAVLAHRPDVDAQRIGLFGDSKGGELALFAASTYPEIRAVVALVPSPFAWSGASGGSSWSINGKPVPYVRLERSRVRRIAPMGGLDMRSVYDASMNLHRSAIEAAMFHLENVRGPMLCIAGDDDAVWDSPAQCELGMAYLRAHGHAFADAYVHYPHAGHAFLFATRDRPQTATGGTPGGNVDAGERAWAAIEEFLRTALGS